MKLSIIIPTYNRINSLLLTLESYYKDKEKIFEIIIIDQSSESIEIKIKDKYPEIKIKYIHHPYPSLTKARNIGIDNVEGDLVIFSDDDIELKENTLNNLLNIFQKEPNISLIGGLDSTEIQTVYRKIKLKDFLSGMCGRKRLSKLKYGNTGFGIFGNFPVSLTKNQLVETDWAMGFFFCCRMENIKKWRMRFDEELVSYAYAEDLDFTQRYYFKSKIENQKMVFTSEVMVAHKCSKEYRTPNFKVNLMYVIHREYLAHKLKKGIKGFIYIQINDLITLMYKILKKQNASEFIKAKILSWKIRKELKNLNIPIEIKEILGKK